jgi:hypothetical protein
LISSVVTEGTKTKLTFVSGAKDEDDDGSGGLLPQSAALKLSLSLRGVLVKNMASELAWIAPIFVRLAAESLSFEDRAAAYLALKEKKRQQREEQEKQQKRPTTRGRRKQTEKDETAVVEEEEPQVSLLIIEALLLPPRRPTEQSLKGLEAAVLHARGAENRGDQLLAAVRAATAPSPCVTVPASGPNQGKPKFAAEKTRQSFAAFQSNARALLEYAGPGSVGEASGALMLVLGPLMLHGGGSSAPYYKDVEIKEMDGLPLPCRSNYASCIPGVGEESEDAENAMAGV